MGCMRGAPLFPALPWSSSPIKSCHLCPLFSIQGFTNFPRNTSAAETPLYYNIPKPNAQCCYYWIHLMNPNILGECINSTCSFNRKLWKHSHPTEPNFFLPYLFSTITITRRAVDVQICILIYFSATVKPTQTFQLHW